MPVLLFYLSGGATQSVVRPGPAPNAAAVLYVCQRGSQGQRSPEQPRSAHLSDEDGQGSHRQLHPLPRKICEY